MNIFYLDESPENCAKALHDVHLTKMILETGQMLSTCIRSVDNVFTEKYDDKLYKSFGPNHPCNMWLRDGFNNFLWLADLFFYMAQEYEYRKEGTQHKTWIELQNIIWEFIDSTWEGEFQSKISKMDHPQVMPEYYQIKGEPIKAYRDYYKGSKLTDKNGKCIAYWTKREMPYWL
jgi:hypothetical protein